jgi:iron complex outermembrane receptor protein/vitamin B12 transporter
MEKYLSLIKNRLYEGNYSCVICNANWVRTFTQQGVNDLLELYRQEPALLEGAAVADKIVGKAAASLLLLGRVKSVYAGVISEPALDLLGTSDVEVEYDEKVPYIENRNKTGWCPMEKACYGITTPEEIYRVIMNFITQ